MAKETAKEMVKPILEAGASRSLNKVISIIALIYKIYLNYIWETYLVFFEYFTSISLGIISLIFCWYFNTKSG
ncbi:hypothetical protein F4806DRAFT_443773 [Annulohypoxylon nitens]|nr:hypothetical protein F4806DRAFT_443773 [Annulohypoxylon nitens]